MKNESADQQPANNKPAVDWAGVIASAFATSIIVFTRRRFGRRYFGMQAALVVPLILVYALLWQGKDLRPLLWFLVAYFFACAKARAGLLWRRWRGDTEHSRYAGEPYLLRLFPFLGEVAIKRVVEPLLCFFSGVFLLASNQPLGFYLMIAAFAMAIMANTQEQWERTRLLDLNDAMIEQKQLGERWRGGQSNRRQ